MKNISYITILFVSLLCICGVSHAKEEDPSQKLNETVSAALDVLYGPEAASLSASEKRARMVATVEGSYDLSVLIRRAMGRNWRKLTEAEQEETMLLFKRLLVKVTYDNLSELTDKPKVSYDDTVYLSDKRATVTSTIIADGQTYYITYSLGKLASGWQLYDVAGEDISFVANYRQQFDDHFLRSDGQGLINKLNELLNNNDPNEKYKL